jgi:hypothetical protein
MSRILCSSPATFEVATLLAWQQSKAVFRVRVSRIQVTYFRLGPLPSRFFHSPD